MHSETGLPYLAGLREELLVQQLPLAWGQCFVFGPWK
ncbi:hypothetical protein APTSU1_000180300 [Apodemus speciosus]|uniref:Uncharacterized protein n=1 Tax=Apodemus speciosus TaxID=105296 RepID=A0ABQ0EHI6_APOSI